MCDLRIFWVLVVFSHLVIFPDYVWVPLSLVRSQHLCPQFSPRYQCSTLLQAVYACARGGKTQAHTILRSFQFYLYLQHSCSTKWKWKSLSCVRLFVTPWLYSPRNSPGQNTGVGSLSLLQGDLPNPRIKPRSPALKADFLPAEPQGKPHVLQITFKKKC